MVRIGRREAQLGRQSEGRSESAFAKDYTERAGKCLDLQIFVLVTPYQNGPTAAPSLAKTACQYPSEAASSIGWELEDLETFICAVLVGDCKDDPAGEAACHCSSFERSAGIHGEGGFVPCASS